VLDLVDLRGPEIVDERRAASLLGLRIQFMRLPDHLMAIPSRARISSFIGAKDGTAYVNVQQDPAEMRFAIAREIGRWTMHREHLDAPGYDGVSVRSGHPKSAEQREAEIFASHLLAPEYRIRHWRSEGSRGSASLGRILGVPATVIQDRIAA